MCCVGVVVRKLYARQEASGSNPAEHKIFNFFVYYGVS
jgi:hypothetical protein